MELTETLWEVTQWQPEVDALSIAPTLAAESADTQVSRNTANVGYGEG